MSDGAKHQKQAHTAVSRMVGHALTLADYEAWSGAAFVFRARLSAAERAALAWAALRSLDREQAEAVAETFDCFPGGVGTPDDPFADIRDAAAMWASCASEDEIDTYALATFRAMSPERQREFVAYLTGQVKAA